ncbi:hypothetical protein EV385_6742 [Krasilnikovia cinnamomea]|uniref:Uncharacterized protein n=1 Tax=Krasilnikovia cinnamomea TaxID=349313 RepID=A0A4Q7Z9U9_9ACTN|nr:hypothetical protein [Krasilnikovia cinnamomea]RZU46665.1 hypothetical protein EV385_6742 [Krasilnikovia cinnamomea]
MDGLTVVHAYLADRLTRLRACAYLADQRALEKALEPEGCSRLSLAGRIAAIVHAYLADLGAPSGLARAYLADRSGLQVPWLAVVHAYLADRDRERCGQPAYEGSVHAYLAD